MAAQQEGKETLGGNKTSTGGVRSTRLVAALVLVLAAPMLMLSSLALALFYIAPTRFGDFLARLPGEVAIRTVLFFAPVTLFAIVVLAMLYAFEKPLVEITRPISIRPRESRPKRSIADLSPRMHRLSWRSLMVTIPVFLASISIRAAAFLSPIKFENFLKRFPAGSVLNGLFEVGPILLLLMLVGELALLIRSRAGMMEGEEKGISQIRRWFYRVGPARLAVGVVLALAVPLLMASLLALSAFFLRPQQTLAILDNLPNEVVLRMGLIFAPASLFVVVSMAMLFLLQRSYSTQAGAWMEGGAMPEGFIGRQVWSWYGSWLLVGGVAIANAAIFGLIVGMAVLLLR